MDTFRIIRQSAQGAWSICWLSCCISYADKFILQSTTHQTAADTTRTHTWNSRAAGYTSITVTRIEYQQIWISTMIRPDLISNCSSHSAARAYSSSLYQQLASLQLAFDIQHLPRDSTSGIHSWDSSSEILRHHLRFVQIGGSVQSAHTNKNKYYSTADSVASPHQLCVSIRQYTNCKHTLTRHIRSGGNTHTHD